MSYYYYYYYLFVLISFLFHFLETGAHVAHDGLNLGFLIFLPPLLEYWDYKHAPPHMAYVVL